MRQKIKTREGFTIVELIVGMSIFTVAVTLATGIFIRGLRSERRIIAEMAVNNSMNFVLEQMARDIRLGYGFPSVAQSDSLSFNGRGGVVVRYWFDSGSKAIMRDAERIISQNVEVQNLQFFNQNSGDSCAPPRVTILVGVRAKNSTKIVNVQTTISSRVLPADIDDENGVACRKNIYLSP